MNIPYQIFGYRECFSQNEIDKIIKLPISIDLFDILELSADEIVTSGYGSRTTCYYCIFDDGE